MHVHWRGPPRHTSATGPGGKETSPNIPYSSRHKIVIGRDRMLLGRCGQTALIDASYKARRLPPQALLFNMFKAEVFRFFPKR